MQCFGSSRVCWTRPSDRYVLRRDQFSAHVGHTKVSPPSRRTSDASIVDPVSVLRHDPPSPPSVSPEPRLPQSMRR